MKVIFWLKHEGKIRIKLHFKMILWKKIVNVLDLC